MSSAWRVVSIRRRLTKESWNGIGVANGSLFGFLSTVGDKGSVQGYPVLQAAVRTGLVFLKVFPKDISIARKNLVSVGLLHLELSD